jgi:hypothetical protein
MGAHLAVSVRHWVNNESAYDGTPAEHHPTGAGLSPAEFGALPHLGTVEAAYLSLAPITARTKSQIPAADWLFPAILGVMSQDLWG